MGKSQLEEKDRSDGAPVEMTPMTETGLCPYCLGSFKIVRGVLPRHGFRAHNVRHGTSGGFHTGACNGAGHQKIGTEAGNTKALDNATFYQARGEELAALPAFTREEGKAATIRAAQDTHLTRRANAWATPVPPTAEQRAAYATPEAFANTSVRGWFSDASYDHRAKSMTRERTQRAEAMITHAAALREAVAQNPA